MAPSEMYLFSFLLLTSVVASSNQLVCAPADVRRPAYTDISVECGTSTISLAIQACPVIYTGYNESLLFLNYNKNPQCMGVLDATATPPVVRYNFPLNMTNSCSSIFTTTSAAGTGVFSDFSNIQTVNVSGVVRSDDPTTGMVTYNAELKYFYSCAYPLEYLINNTRLDVSAASIAVKDNNGSFISTLSMSLWSDINYTIPLVVPQMGLELRTRVYVQVKATNLTKQYNVLLDRCYASISPLPGNSSYFNLFVPCSKDPMTIMYQNGDSSCARYSFSAFRFTEQQNQTVSTYYLHCITRLCEISTCASFKLCGARRRRAVTAAISNGATESTLLSSPVPIVTSSESLSSKVQAPVVKESSSTGLGVAVGLLAVAVVIVVAIAAVFYRRLKHF